MERCKCENNKRFYGGCFQHGISYEEWINWLLVNQTKHEHSMVLYVFSWSLQKDFACLSIMLTIVYVDNDPLYRPNVRLRPLIDYIYE